VRRGGLRRRGGLNAGYRAPRTAGGLLTRGVGLFVVAILGAWLLGLVVFVADVARMSPNMTIPTDAIVVLTGGTNRVTAGRDLLVAGVAKRLFVSGVGGGSTIADVFATAPVPADLQACCVELGREAADTLGNAAEAGEWMRRNGLTTLQLVTAHYHMQRAKVEFERANPDLFVVPHPVAPDRVQVEGWWRRARTARLLVTEYNKLLVAMAPAWFRRVAFDWLGHDTPR
jgi:uncharacterized SAM-binding protein YcdF (DUF218 family)